MEKTRVLVIDDNESLINMIKEYFKDNESISIVLSANDGLEGLEKIGNNQDKFTFYWYDKIGDKIVKLSNKYNIDTEADADGGYIFMYEKDENLGGVYYPEFNRFHIDYKQYTFEFLNYLVEKEQSCIAGIQLKAPKISTNVGSTVSDGAMKVDIYITATKDGYTLPYKLTDCICYLYVCDTEEIIAGTISVIRED